MIDEDRVHDDPNIEATVLRYLPFLRRECAKVPARVHPPGWDLEDLVQESLAWALVQARRYNPDRGASLETWVGNCMRWAPRTVSQRAHGVPNSAIDRAGDIRRARALLASTGRPSADEDVARWLEIPVGQLQRRAARGRLPDLVGVDEPVPGFDDLVVGDMLEDDGPDPEALALASLDGEVVRRALGRLDKRHRYVLEQRAAGRTLADIARDLGLSRERVRQLEHAALAEIRPLIPQERTDMDMDWTRKTEIVDGACIIHRCPKRAKYRGLCSTHYSRASKAGILDEVAMPAKTGVRPAAETAAQPGEADPGSQGDRESPAAPFEPAERPATPSERVDLADALLVLERVHAAADRLLLMLDATDLHGAANMKIERAASIIRPHLEAGNELAATLRRRAAEVGVDAAGKPALQILGDIIAVRTPAPVDDDLQRQLQAALDEARTEVDRLRAERRTTEGTLRALSALINEAAVASGEEVRHGIISAAVDVLAGWQQRNGGVDG